MSATLELYDSVSAYERSVREHCDDELLVERLVWRFAAVEAQRIGGRA